MSSAVSPTHSSFLASRAAYITPGHASRPIAAAPSWPAVPLSSSALAAEADAPLNLGLDEDEDVWKGESVGLGFGLLGRLKDKTNALLEAIDWDCKLCGKTSTDPCVTRCGHLFCWSHLTKHLSKYPSCPTCATPLSIDRDAVQVFGRPKVIPSDAPWTSASQTPGSRGSAVSTNSIPNPRDPVFPLGRQGSDASTSSLGLELGIGNNTDVVINALPPPPASPTDSRSRSAPSSRSLSTTDLGSSIQKKSSRRGVKPLTVISNFQDGPNIFITSDSPLSMTEKDRPYGEINLNDREAKEEDPWASWRRSSESSTAMPSSSTTRRPSHVPSAATIDSLRPPSPQLRTKPFRPGWAQRQTERQLSTSERHSSKNASTDSFDAHVRQSVEVKFTRGLNPTYDTSFEEGSDMEDEEDPEAIYLHSPARKAELGVLREAGVGEILSPVPQYGWKPKLDGWSSYSHSQGASSPAQSALSPTLEHSSIAPAPAPDADHRADGRNFYKELYGRRQRVAVQAGKSETKADASTTVKEKGSEDNFGKLKTAVEKVKEEGKEATTGDTIGRALCVFAVVLLVKILIK